MVIKLNITHSIAIVIVVAGCTMVLRAVPFLLFGGNKKIPEVILFLGKYLPPAIMATLVVYCLRNIQLFVGTRGIPEIISVLFVATIHGWKKNILLSVGMGTACYMLLVQMVFK